MRRFKRRKPRVAWFPVFGDSSYAEYNADGAAIGIRFENNTGSASPAHSIDSDAVGITWDGTQSAAANQGFGSTTETLSDFVQGTGYRLRRLVGKIWISTGAVTNGNVAAVRVGFGFIILRTRDDGALGSNIQWVNPLAQDSADDPWIWRRNWVLSPNPATATLAPEVPWTNLPRTNVGLVGNDGPHIDQKTARIVGPQERLVAIMSSQVIQTTDDLAPTGEITVHGLLDYRILGSMRSNIGNRNNASR